MPTLIDGHNLIPHIPGINLADADDEFQLVLVLRRYATRHRNRRVVVVFDGGVYGHPDNLNGYNVTCYFAKSPRDGDRELMQRIRQIKRTDEWEVVTSDRAVAGVARAHGVQVVASDVFARRLDRDKEELPPVQLEEKFQDRPLSKREVEEWLELFGGEDLPPEQN